MPINHRVVIGIVWESSARQQGMEVQRRARWESRFPARHSAMALALSLLPCAPTDKPSLFLFSCPRKIFPPALGKAPTSPGRDAFDSSRRGKEDLLTPRYRAAHLVIGVISSAGYPRKSMLLFCQGHVMLDRGENECLGIIKWFLNGGSDLGGGEKGAWLVCDTGSDCLPGLY